MVGIIFCNAVNFRSGLTGKFPMISLGNPKQVLIYLCIYLLQFALMETVTTAILDKFPNLRQYKTWVVLFVGIFGYIGGLGFTTNVSIPLAIWKPQRLLIFDVFVFVCVRRVACIGCN